MHNKTFEELLENHLNMMAYNRINSIECRKIRIINKGQNWGKKL